MLYLALDSSAFKSKSFVDRMVLILEQSGGSALSSADRPYLMETCRILGEASYGNLWLPPGF